MTTKILSIPGARPITIEMNPLGQAPVGVGPAIDAQMSRRIPVRSETVAVSSAAFATFHRRKVDVISDFLFIPTIHSAINLADESSQRMALITGNSVIGALPGMTTRIRRDSMGQGIASL